MELYSALRGRVALNLSAQILFFVCLFVAHEQLHMKLFGCNNCENGFVSCRFPGKNIPIKRNSLEIFVCCVPRNVERKE